MNEENRENWTKYIEDKEKGQWIICVFVEAIFPVLSARFVYHHDDARESRDVRPPLLYIYVYELIYRQ